MTDSDESDEIMLNISVTHQSGDTQFYGIIQEYVTGSSTSMTAPTVGELVNDALLWSMLDPATYAITAEDTPDQIREKIAANPDPEVGVTIQMGVNY